VRKPVRRFYIYIVSSKRRTLYIGVTSDLKQRVHQHQNGLIPGFSSRYMCKSLVYFEELAYVRDAIAREKQLKGWRRAKKIALIEKENPEWKDLSADWAWW
jgi:putative endonuclease